MNISKEDFIKEYYIEKDGKFINPRFEYESFDIETMSYIGLTIIKTAEEMLEAENKIDICLEPTEIQILQDQVTKLIINQL